MAAHFVKFHKQRERDRDHYKDVIAQMDVEMEEIKARWQQEAAQQMAECKKHLKRMESRFNQVPSNQAMKEQPSQRDLEIQVEDIQVRNNISEEQFAMQKQCDEEFIIVKERLSSQTIDVDQISDGEDEVKQLLKATSEQANLVDPLLNAEPEDFGPTPKESMASPGSQQSGDIASLLPQAPKVDTPSPVAKQKRSRGPGKSKSPGPRQIDDQMSPGFA